MTSPYDYMGQVATPGFEFPTSNEFQYGNQTNDPFKILTGQTFNPYQVLSQNPYLNQAQSTSTTTTTPAADMYTDYQAIMPQDNGSLFSDYVPGAMINPTTNPNAEGYSWATDPSNPYSTLYGFSSTMANDLNLKGKPYNDPNNPDFKPI